MKEGASGNEERERDESGGRDREREMGEKECMVMRGCIDLQLYKRQSELLKRRLHA